ncbi:MAG: alpha/beta fold hydrolase [bacterium]
MKTSQLLICIFAILVPMGCDVVPPHLPDHRNTNGSNSTATQATPRESVHKTAAGLVRKTFLDSDGPAYVLLHGYGSNEGDMDALSKRLGVAGDVIGYRAPIVMTTGRYAWFPVTFSSEGSRYRDEDVVTAAQKVIESLEGEVKKPVTLMGFSQGGMLSLYVGLSRPDLVERVVVLSGPGPLPEPRDTKAPRVFLAHGTGDLVIPVERSQTVYQELKKRGVDATYVEIEGLPHAVDDEIVQKLSTWLSDN